jgi:hypothetical protein
MPAAVAAVQAALKNPDCVGIFGTPPSSYGILGPSLGYSALSVFNYLINNNDISFDLFTGKSAVDIAQTKQTTSILGGLGVTTDVPTITINSTTTGVPGNAGFWNLSSTTTNAETLLHELGHALYDIGWSGDQIPPDATDDFQEKLNQDTVADKCGPALGGK